MKKVSIILLILVLLTTDAFADVIVEEEKTDVAQIVAIATLAITVFGIIIYAIHVRNKKQKKEKMESEEVRIIVEENGDVDVKGKFWITNNSKNENDVRMYFPYAEADYLHSPECIGIETNYKDSTVKHEYMNKGNGWSFNTSLKPEEKNIIAVHYQQKTKENSFKYILTSARKWGSPIESAEFVIKIPERYELTNSTYNYEYIGQDTDKNVYRIIENELFPSKELEFSWGEKRF